MARLRGLVMLAVLLATVSQTLGASTARVDHRQDTTLIDSAYKTFRKLFHVKSTPDTNRRPNRSLQLAAVFNCTTNESCRPPELRDVPISSDLISCDTDTRLCVCNDCFVLVNDSCQVNAPCRGYSQKSLECTENRQSQKTAVLLSVFLSSLGAANFYIEDYLLGGIQLALFVLLCLLTCAIVCVPCCCFLYDEEEFEEMLENRLSVCLFMVTAIVIFLLVVIVMSWWVADLTVFVQNSRNSGNGCMLIADL